MMGPARSCGRLMGRIPRPLDMLLHRVVIYSAPRKRVHGILTSCSDDDVDCDVFFQRIQHALDLIGRYDERRLERMKRDVKAIALGLPAFSYSFYAPSVAAVFLNAKLFPAASAENIAAVLVHEATHARLDQAGHRNHAESRERHERICIAEQLAFVRRLPNSEALANAILRLAEQPWWDEAVRRPHAEQALEDLGVPDWLKRFLVPFFVGSD